MRKGNWIQTYTGRQFWPLDPRPEELCLEDIAHALSNQCRFSGHTNTFYSVAQHSANVAEYLKDTTKMFQQWGLMHDASEAYLVDVPRPIKQLLPEYVRAEEILQEVVARRFDLPIIIPNSVRDADDVMLASEKKFLLKPAPAPWDELPDPIDDGLWFEEMPPRLARDYFLTIAEKLGIK